MLEVPLRVRNLWDRPLHAPLRLSVTVGGAFAGVTGMLPALPGGGTTAVYALDSVIRVPEMLLPGERTAPLVVRFKMVERPARTAPIVLTFSLSAGAEEPSPAASSSP